MLNKLSGSHVYGNTDIAYYPLGEELFAAMASDLQKAEKFIFMEYFIIEGGLFWGSILEILKAKAASGVEVRVVYDDIGCMMTLPGNYGKQLKKFGIKCVPFARLRGQANNEFNNRRKTRALEGRRHTPARRSRKRADAAVPYRLRLERQKGERRFFAILPLRAIRLRRILHSVRRRTEAHLRAAGV